MSIIRDKRTKSGFSQSAAAAIAKVSPTTWRIYEAAPDAVSPAVRAACDAAMAQLETLRTGRAA